MEIQALGMRSRFEWAVKAERAACPHVGTLSGAEHLGGDAWRPERSSSRVSRLCYVPVAVAGMSQPGPPPTVFIIDDDADVRVSIAELLRSVGLRAEMFASAPEFLAREREAGPSCLVLDLGLPGMSGLDIQCELARTGTSIPIDPCHRPLRVDAPRVCTERPERVRCRPPPCGIACRSVRNERLVGSPKH